MRLRPEVQRPLQQKARTPAQALVLGRYVALTRFYCKSASHPSNSGPDCPATADVTRWAPVDRRAIAAARPTTACPQTLQLSCQI
jgi:hypothetical protein